MSASRAFPPRRPPKRILLHRTTPSHAFHHPQGTPLSRHCLHQTRQSSSPADPPPTTPSNPPKPTKRPPKTALFFPGHGVHRHAMLHPWLTHHPRTSQPYLAEVDQIMGYSLSDLIENGTNSTLNQTQHSQPAILATSILILKILEHDFNFSTSTRIDATLGHSLGEFAALVAARYLDWRDALKLVKRRAEVMAQLSQQARESYPIAGEGDVGMVALIVPHASDLPGLIHSIQEFLDVGGPGTRADSAAGVPDPLQQVTIANVNSGNQIVLSGVLGRMRTLLANLREFGGHDPRAVVLKTESPFHCRIMQPAADVTKELLYGMRSGAAGDRDVIQIPSGNPIPVISNITALPFPTPPHDTRPLKDLLARQCVETVRWADSVRYLDGTMGIRRWIGIGPGKVGRNLVGKEVGMRGPVRGGGVWGVTDPWEMEEMVRGLEGTEEGEEDEAVAMG